MRMPSPRPGRLRTWAAGLCIAGAVDGEHAPVQAIAAGAARLVLAWAQSHGSRPVIADAAARHLVAPLATDLLTTAAVCALAAAVISAARRIRPRS